MADISSLHTQLSWPFWTPCALCIWPASCWLLTWLTGWFWLTGWCFHAAPINMLHFNVSCFVSFVSFTGVRFVLATFDVFARNIF